MTKQQFVQHMENNINIWFSEHELELVLSEIDFFWAENEEISKEEFTHNFINYDDEPITEELYRNCINCIDTFWGDEEIDEEPDEYPEDYEYRIDQRDNFLDDDF